MPAPPKTCAARSLGLPHDRPAGSLPNGCVVQGVIMGNEAVSAVALPDIADATSDANQRAPCVFLPAGPTDVRYWSVNDDAAHAGFLPSPMLMAGPSPMTSNFGQATIHRPPFVT